MLFIIKYLSTRLRINIMITTHFKKDKTYFKHSPYAAGDQNVQTKIFF